MLKYVLVLVLVLSVVADDVCPASVQQTCQTDIQIAYQKCDAAAKKKGKDQQADVDCVRYFTSMRKECWPCICEIAKKQGWKIKGCDTIQLLRKMIRSHP